MLDLIVFKLFIRAINRTKLIPGQSRSSHAPSSWFLVSGPRPWKKHFRLQNAYQQQALSSPSQDVKLYLANSHDISLKCNSVNVVHCSTSEWTNAESSRG